MFLGTCGAFGFSLGGFTEADDFALGAAVDAAEGAADGEAFAIGPADAASGALELDEARGCDAGASASDEPTGGAEVGCAEALDAAGSGASPGLIIATAT